MTGSPPLQVELTKQADGGAVLRCVRADGSTTWQRHAGAQARFFPLHDLTHLAVEQVLGARAGFFGLVAAGWEIADTTGKGARGPLPKEALRVERLVGWLDAERASGAEWTAADLAAAYPPADRLAPCVSDALLARVRAERAALFARWAALPPGATLALHFAPPGA